MPVPHPSNRPNPRNAADLLQAASTRDLSRRGFLAASGVGLAAFLTACGGSSGSGSSSGGSTAAAATTPSSGPAAVTYPKGGELNVYSWPDYFDPKHLAAWKDKTAAKLNVATYDGNDAMFAKLNTAAGSEYDMAIPTSSWIDTMVQRDILQEIDPERIPWQHIDRELLDQAYDKGNRYSVPKDFGTSGVIYDPSVVGGELKTWQDFVDAAQKPGVSGKMSIPDGGNQALAIGLWINGQNWDTPDIAQWQKAADLVRDQLVPHVKTFGATFDIDAYVTGKLVMGTTDSSVARQMVIKNPKLKYVTLLPHTELWVDNFTITKDAADLDQAYSFIQYFLQPDVQVAETSFHGYPTVLPGIRGKLGSKFKHADVVFPTAAQYETFQGQKIQPKIQGKIDQMFQQLKASAA
jgi:spermidine/putrescine transport system substrate-binding protein